MGSASAFGVRPICGVMETEKPAAPGAAFNNLDSPGLQVFFIMIGAIPGALLRWKINLAFGSNSRWSTVGINAVGSLILGAIAALGTTIPTPVPLAIGTGFCGSFTTFSTYAVDVVKLFDANAPGEAVLAFFLTNILGIGFAALSFMLTKNGMRR